MPTDAENIKFLQICMKHAGNYKIDYVAVGKALDMKPGTASMRINRMNKAIKNGEQPSAGGLRFLWTCLTVGNGSALPTINWAKVGAEMGLKTGTANMRLTRLKKQIDTAPAVAFGGSPSSVPSTPNKKAKTSTSTSFTTPPSSTTRRSKPASKVKAAIAKAAEKRKRTSNESDFDSGSEAEDYEELDQRSGSSEDEGKDNGPASPRSFTPRKTKAHASNLVSTLIKEEEEDSDSSPSVVASDISSFSTTTAEEQRKSQSQSLSRFGSSFSDVDDMFRNEFEVEQRRMAGMETKDPWAPDPSPDLETLELFRPEPLDDNTRSFISNGAVNRDVGARTKNDHNETSDMFRAEEDDGEDAFVGAPEQLVGMEFDAYKEAGIDEDTYAFGTFFETEV